MGAVLAATFKAENDSQGHFYDKYFPYPADNYKAELRHPWEGLIMYVSFNSQESYFRQQSYVLTSNGHGEGRDNKSDSVSATDHMLNKLAEKIPGMSSSEMKSLSADQFSPEKVADRIADFVSQGLEQARRDGKSEGELHKLYEQAVKGIEQGFSEAKDILKDMNLLSDDIEATIDTTIDLTMQKIDALNPAPVDKPQGPTSTSMLAAINQ